MKRYFFCALLILIAPAFAQEAHPPISLHPQNSHYLFWRGKPTVLITSGEHYGAVLNSEFDFIPYFNELQNKTLNLTRTFSGAYREVPGNFGITDNTLAPNKGKYIAPWARSNTPGESDGGNKFDLSQFDPAYFNRLKQILSEASKRGIVVEYVLFCPFYEDTMWAASPMNAKNNVNGIGNAKREEVYALKHKDLTAAQEALVRKVVAELKDFDNLYYEICNEPYFGGVTLEWQAHIAKTIADAEKDFPNKHLIAQNIANDKAKIDKPNPLVSIFNFHYATPPDTVAMNYHLNKPIGDDETGFRGKDDVHYRTEGWDFIIAGGAIYSNLDYSFTHKHPDGSFLDYKSPGGGNPAFRTQMKILKEFIEAFEFVKMRPANDVIRGGTITSPLSGGQTPRVGATVRCLAEPEKAYAIYVRGGSKAEIKLRVRNGQWKAQWVNTKTGKIDKEESFTHDGGDKTLSSPDYREDIALRVVAQ